MEKFAKSDVTNVTSFWARPESGQIFRNESSHTISALNPDGPIHLNPADFDHLDDDDFAVFHAAFRLGWVRSVYHIGEGKADTQLALHGPTEVILKLTAHMLLDCGLEMDHIGLRGEFDNFEYNGSPDDIEA